MNIHKILNRPVGVVGKDIASVRKVFDSIPGLVKSDALSPTARRFFRAVLPRSYAAEMDLATRNTLRRNTPNITKI